MDFKVPPYVDERNPNVELAVNERMGMQSEQLPLVSVVIPVFNGGAMLHRSFGGLFNLTYRNLEFIVIDDASTDNSHSILSELVRSDPRARLILLERNRGAAGARNEGLGQARGKYVWFVDWDDEWEPNILDLLVEEAEAENAEVAMCRGMWRSRDGENGPITDGTDTREVMSGPDAFDLLLKGTIKGYLWTKLFRRSSLPNAMFPEIETQEDISGLVPVLTRSSCVVSVPDVLYWHIVRPGSLSNSRSPNLHNLTVAREFIRSAASAIEQTQQRTSLLVYYDYAYWHLSRVTTAIRLSSPEVVRREIRDVRGQMRYAEMVDLFRHSRKIGTMAFVLKLFGPIFPAIRAVAIGTPIRKIHRPRRFRSANKARQWV